jgi:diaminobutyrate-2-oxoglutarate transaminase
VKGVNVSESGLEVFETSESSVRSYIRSFPVVFDTARGSIMRTETGAEYIDFFAGAGTLNYGHNNPIFKAKIIEYLERDSITHGLDMATVAKRRFIELFRDSILSPRGMSYRLQFTGPTGTNAVEAALKVARNATGRSNMIAFTHAFHGVSLGSVAVTANPKFRQAAGVGLDDVTFMPYDGYLGADIDTLDYLERTLTDPGSGLDKPAGVIVETIQCEGGINVARAEWLRRLEAICRAHDMLLIVDEIQVGVGRTGSFFSFESAGISPDVVTLSKSLSGFGLPMSLVLIKEEYDNWKPGAHSGTFRGNNLAFVGAAAAIETYWQDSTFMDGVAERSAIALSRLESLVSRYPQAELEIRGRGLVLGLASERKPELMGAVAAECFRHGLVIETAGVHDEVLKLLPALTIELDVLARGLDIIEASLESVISA